MENTLKVNGGGVSNKVRPGNSSLEVTGNKAEFTGITKNRIKNEKDLIAVAKIDTRQWIIERWICNKWEMAAKLGDDSIQVTELWQVKAWLKRNVEAVVYDRIKKTVLGEIRETAKGRNKSRARIKTGRYTDPCLAVFDIPDLHLDKLAWGKETGEDWDIKISSRAFINTLNDLVSKASVYNVDRILFPVGNDFFNADTLENTTTKGTRQQVDGRWKKSFSVGWNLLVSAIMKLSTVAPVDVIVVPGNHDEQKTFYLGEVLSARFFADKNVSIDNSPKGRKYYRYGKTLLGYAHGKDEKIDRLPMIMTTEAKELFNKTEYQEWHLGDKHHKKDIKFTPAAEVDGIIIRTLSSLSPVDDWHYKKGYLAKRAGQGFIYDKERGWVCQFNTFLN